MVKRISLIYGDAKASSASLMICRTRGIEPKGHGDFQSVFAPPASDYTERKLNSAMKVRAIRGRRLGPRFIGGRAHDNAELLFFIKWWGGRI